MLGRLPKSAAETFFSLFVQKITRTPTSPGAFQVKTASSTERPDPQFRTLPSLSSAGVFFSLTDNSCSPPFSVKPVTEFQEQSMFFSSHSRICFALFHPPLFTLSFFPFPSFFLPSLLSFFPQKPPPTSLSDPSSPSTFLPPSLLPLPSHLLPSLHLPPCHLPSPLPCHRHPTSRTHRRATGGACRRCGR